MFCFSQMRIKHNVLLNNAIVIFHWELNINKTWKDLTHN